MSNFTIGNWVFWKNKKYPYWYVGKEGSERYIATVDKEANARLIAAAPEMYKLLKFFCEDKAIDEDRFDDYLAAIFEAKKLFNFIDGDSQEV